MIRLTGYENSLFGHYTQGHPSFFRTKLLSIFITNPFRLMSSWMVCRELFSLSTRIGIENQAHEYSFV